MDPLYAEIIKALEKKEKVTLATLVKRVGSAPRAVGAKYLVKEDGTTCGTIGGGSLEAEVWQGAKEALRKGEGGVLHFELTAEQLAAGGLLCGGDVDIFLEPLQEDVTDIYREVLRIKNRGGSALLVTAMSVEGRFPREGGTKLLMRPSGEKMGFLLGGGKLEEAVVKEGQNLYREQNPKAATFLVEGRKVEVLLEPVISEPTVYLFGGGHISQQVCPLAKKVHFKVVVIDDREMFAKPERFPEADEIVVSKFEKSFEGLTIDDSSYIIIVTRGHLSDHLVLEQALQTQARYIGMIGSKKKIGTLYHHLMEKGVAPKALERVHAPIGLDIHSETPEEIAVSIVAQLIQVRGEEEERRLS